MTTLLVIIGIIAAVGLTVSVFVAVMIYRIAKVIVEAREEGWGNE